MKRKRGKEKQFINPAQPRMSIYIVVSLCDPGISPIILWRVWFLKCTRKKEKH